MKALTMKRVQVAWVEKKGLTFPSTIGMEGVDEDKNGGGIDVDE
jgi:hypothetical protein